MFALTLDDNQDKIYALAAFYDYPNVHGIPSADWEDKWWKPTYGKNDPTTNINAINTLFLHFFVAHPDFSEGCAEELINVTFKALPEIQQILLCVPQQVTPGSLKPICPCWVLTAVLFTTQQKVHWPNSFIPSTTTVRIIPARWWVVIAKITFQRCLFEKLGKTLSCWLSLSLYHRQYE